MIGGLIEGRVWFYDNGDPPDIEFELEESRYEPIPTSFLHY